MKELQERRRFKKLLHSRYTIILMIVVLALLARGVWGIYTKYQKSLEIKERARYDLEILTGREQSLMESIKALETDEGKERELRDRFGVVKEGEKIVVIVDDKPKEKSFSGSENTNWWIRFLEMFK